MSTSFNTLITYSCSDLELINYPPDLHLENEFKDNVTSSTPTTASFYSSSDLELINYPLEFRFGSESEDNVFDQAFEDFTNALTDLEQQEKAVEYMIIPEDFDLQPQYQFPQTAP
jgi:hypothetical protein